METNATTARYLLNDQTGEMYGQEYLDARHERTLDRVRDIEQRVALIEESVRDLAASLGQSLDLMLDAVRIVTEGGPKAIEEDETYEYERAVEDEAYRVAVECEVAVLTGDALAAARRDGRAAMCMTCGRSWDDSISTPYTPAPAGRCPFEHLHDEEPEPFLVCPPCLASTAWGDEYEPLTGGDSMLVECCDACGDLGTVIACRERLDA